MRNPDNSEIPSDLCTQMVADDPYGRVIVDGEGNIQYLNRAAADLIGIDPNDALGRFMLDYVAPEDQQAAVAGLIEMQAAGPIESEGIPQVFRIVRSDGTRTHVEVGAQNYLRSDGPEVVMLRLRPFDGQAHMQRFFVSMAKEGLLGPNQHELVGSVDNMIQSAATALCSGWDGNYFHQITSQLLPETLCGGRPDPAAEPHDDQEATPWAEALRSAELTYRSVDELPPDLRRAADAAGYRSCWVAPVASSLDLRRRDSAFVIWRSVDGPPMLGHRDGLARAVGAAVFGFERAAHQRALHEAATVDPLTRLPNRAQVFHTLADTRQRARAVLYLDLDGFKQVNDVHGHRFGDGILRSVAERLAEEMADTNFLARLGGDEFVVVVRASTSRPDLIATAEHLISRVAEPFDHDGELIRLGLTIGIADHANLDGESLLDAADHALYKAKRNGRGTWSMSNDI